MVLFSGNIDEIYSNAVAVAAASAHDEYGDDMMSFAVGLPSHDLYKSNCTTCL